MATLNISSHTTPQAITIQIKSSERLGSENIPSNEEAESIVMEWAANTNRCLSERELKCLADYMRNNCKAGAEDFDKVLFGWYRRGEDETKNTADAIQGLFSGFQNTQNKIVSLIEKAIAKPTQLQVNPLNEISGRTNENPSPSQPRKRPASLGLSGDEFHVLAHYLHSKTDEESMKIYDIFETLVGIQKEKRRTGTTAQDHQFSFKEIISGTKTLDDFLRLYNMSIEEFVPFTPHGNTAEVMSHFVKHLDVTDWVSLASPGVDLDVDLAARLSVYLSYFNKQK